MGARSITTGKTKMKMRGVYVEAAVSRVLCQKVSTNWKNKR